jgi:hypothetical protein
MKVPAYSGPLFLSIFLLVSTPLLAQTVPAAGTTVAVKMVDTIDSGTDPAGKQYHASVTKAVTAGNGVTIAQGAAALVTLARSGSGYAAQLFSVTINGQQVAVTSNSASVSAAAQSAAGSSAASAVNSVLGGFGRRVSAPASVAAAATGQHVSLPTGTTLTFVLGNPPAANTAAATAPAAPAAQTMTASAPGQDWWMCSYRDVKDPYKPALGSLMYYALIPASGATDGQAGITTHFVGYVRQNYKVNDNATAGAVGAGRCQRFSNDPASRANSMDMTLKQWASSNIESIPVTWTNTPAENAAIDAKLAGAASAAATAAATLTAAANQTYAWCSSEWAGTAGTMMPAGTVMYFSDIFPITPPPQPTQKTGNGSAQIAAQSLASTPFSAFLQKKYGYKNGVRCAVTYPPTLAGLQNAQKYRQEFEDLARHNNGQIVETGWKNQ